MSISYIKDTAKKTLYGKYPNALIITLIYYAFSVAFSLMNSNLFSSNDNVLRITNIIFTIIKLFLGYGLIESLVRISKQSSPVPYTDFINTAVLKCPKVFTVIVNIILRLLIPSVIGGTLLYFIQKITLTATLKGALLIIAYILLIALLLYFSLNYTLSLFCIIDNPEESSKNILNKSKELMKGNKLKYILLCISFIPFFIMIALVSYICSYFLNEFLCTIISSLLTLFIIPYLTISLYIFYEELLPVKTSEENNDNK